VNGDAKDFCCFCDAPLGGLSRSSSSRRVVTPIEGNLAVEPEWRREVSSRLQEYRARRRGGADLQTDLPFETSSAPVVEPSAVRTQVLAPAPAKRAPESRRHRAERFEISIPNLESAPGAGPSRGTSASSSGSAASHAFLYSVASLSERRKAAVADVVLLLVSYGAMLALFTALGGQFGFTKLDLTVAGATFALFYAQYFALFTVFGGSTPGMMLRGLRVVSFNGSLPTSRQMVWRSFGYLISAGTCFLGFVWSLWDEDQLCWQDRISQTYLTPIEKITQH
jgi:uncharacterized RDD family membrane protein YckC